MIRHCLRIFALLLLACCLLCTGCLPTGTSSLLSSAPSKPSIIRTPLIGPHNITLLLPLTGNLASSSTAIKNGFLAAYYSGKTQNTAHNNVNIKVVDTSRQDITSAYQQAVNDGADVIVGPLTKQDVATITKLAPLPVPTIALNTLDNYRAHTAQNLYQFGLSPQDEAYQAALKIMQDGHVRTAIIAQNTPWNNNLLATFTTKYKTIGGQITGALPFTKAANFDTEIKTFLGVTTSDAANTSSTDTAAVAPHREDIDAIFLLATPAQARQIVPLLKYYYAGATPQIYTISNIYTGSPQPDLDQDIDGVKFCDIPWVAEQPANLSLHLQDIRSKVLTLAPNAMQKDARLYALGIDAYTLVASFNNLIRAPNAGISGASGILVLDNYNHIYRKLGWTTMTQGIPNGF